VSRERRPAQLSDYLCPLVDVFVHVDLFLADLT
jgi:hypothetical protein